MGRLGRFWQRKQEPNGGATPHVDRATYGVELTARNNDDATQYVGHWNSLDSEQTKDEVQRLVREGQFPLLLAVVRGAKYPGRAQEALKTCDDAGVAEDLIELLRDPSVSIRCRAAASLGPLGGERAARALCELLPNANYTVTSYIENDEVQYIAWALSDLRWDGAVPALTTALRRARYFYHQVYLAKALARCGGKEGIEFLAGQVDEVVTGRSSVKVYGVAMGEYSGALLASDDPSAIPALQKCLSWIAERDQQEDIAADIREFLRKHGVPEHAPAPASAPTPLTRPSTRRCCICGTDLTSAPAMVDRVTSVAFCQAHASLRSELLDESAFSSCASCGFKYSERLSEFSRGDLPKCANCGASLSEGA